MTTWTTIFLSKIDFFDSLTKGPQPVKARKLWEALGERQYEALDAGDQGILASVLQAHGFDLALGRKVLAFFGPETVQKMEEDPYRLLSFCATWRQVDALAQAHFGIAVDDPKPVLTGFFCAEKERRFD